MTKAPLRLSRITLLVLLLAPWRRADGHRQLLSQGGLVPRVGIR
jgi:hypothetical protein